MPSKRAIRPPREATKKKSAKSAPGRRWSQKVTDTSDAMDLEPGVFKKGPRAIAASLKRSVEKSKRRKGTPFQSAMSMLTFYENRGGKNLTARQRENLEKAKDELRRLYDREKGNVRQ